MLCCFVSRLNSMKRGYRAVSRGEGKAYNEVIIGKKRIIYRQYFHLIDFKIYKLFLSIFYYIRIICDKSRNSFSIYGNSFDLILSLSLSPRLIKDNYN